MVLGKLYRKLWSGVGGRPWTYIIRDTWHQYEGLWIIGLVASGAVAVHYSDLLSVLKALGIFMVGYVGGHLFWGKEWKKGQEPKRQGK